MSQANIWLTKWQKDKIRLRASFTAKSSLTEDILLALFNRWENAINVDNKKTKKKISHKQLGMTKNKHSGEGLEERRNEATGM